MNAPDPTLGAGHGALAYRKDIDGLRALAVVPIVLFHAGITSLGGGFIGVDIFFVISGYLITRIIMGEMATGTFTLSEFYRRRIVRIFPALVAMLVAVLIACILLLLPFEIRAVSRTIAAAAASVSNFLFWRETGYFAASAETNPLLHTWSLAVEEQFYLFFPLFLLLVRRYFFTSVKLLVCLVVLSSLVVGFVLTQVSENAAFYLLPARMWEIGLGAVVALGAFPGATSAAVRQALAIVAALLVSISYVLVRPDLPFPVPTAIPVCFGTAALIAYGEGTWVAGALATPVLRWIGRISYSVYLWHWPIITFYRIEFGFELDLIETAGLVAASLLAGWASYAWIEQPALRRFRSAPSRPAIIAGLAAVAAVVVLSLSAVRLADGLTRFGPEAQAAAKFAEYDKTDAFAIQYGPKGCFVRQADRDFPEAKRQEKCENFSGARSKALLVGDSFAAQFAHALPERFAGFDWSFAMASGCRPTVEGEGSPRCRAIMARAFGELLPGGQIHLVVIGGRWLEEDVVHVRQSLRLARNAGAQVVMLGPILQHDYSFPLLYARALESDDAGALSISDRRDPTQRALEARLREIARAEGVTFVSMIDLECPDGTCPLTDPADNPLRWDYGHYTLAGARWAVARLPDLEAAATTRAGGDVE